MICITITGKTFAETLEQLNKAQALADLIELRLDYQKDHSEAALIKILEDIYEKKTKPMIVTIRSKREGGLFSNKSEDQFFIARKACNIGFEYIDIELGWPSKLYKLLNNNKGETKLIGSYHNFKETLSQHGLRNVVKRIARTHADIFKIACMAKNVTDNVKMFNLIDFINRRYKSPSIAICMGEKGIISRVVQKSMGGYLTFACLDKKKSTAEGQLSYEELVSIQKSFNF